MITRIAILLCAFVGTARSYAESSGASVVLGGTLVDNSNELNIIEGGETIRLTLNMDGLQYRPEVVSTETLFQSFLQDFAHSPQEAAFIMRIKKLLTRERASLHDNRRTLQLTLSPDPEFQISMNESVYLNIPHTVLDCKCTYRIPVLEAITFHPMQVPIPQITAPKVVCTSSFNVSSHPTHPPSQVVATNYKVRWTISDSSSAYFDSDTSRSTRVHHLVQASTVFISVSFILRDGIETTTVPVRRVEAPLPAKVDNEVMHVAGTKARLNAHRVIGGGPDTRGMWTVKQGADVVLYDSTDPNTKVEGLDEKTVMEWRVTGNEECPETTAEVVLLTSRPHISPASAPYQEICTSSHRVSAEDPPLSRLRGTWAVDGPDSSISFLPSPHEPSVSVIGVPHGTTKLTWTLQGDGGSAEAREVVFERKYAPKAAIITSHPKAYLGSAEVIFEAEGPVQGSGTWSVKHTTCDPVPNFKNPESHVGRLEGLDYVSQSCELEVEWTVTNAPCEEDTATLMLAVVPQPPTKPVVGDTVVLCSDVPVKLTGNQVEVGRGRWEAIDPVDQLVPEPDRPRTMLPHVREGTTIMRWTISNGNITESADLEIVRYVLPEARIAMPDAERVTMCGKQFLLEAHNKHFDGNDVGSWGLVSGEATIREPDHYILEITDLQPGETTVQWKAQSLESIDVCHGNTANVTLFSWQFPEAPYTVYTTSPEAVVKLPAVLEQACRGNPMFYPSYVDELSKLGGVWSVEKNSRITLENERSGAVRLKGIPMGISTLRWSPDVCDGEQWLVVKVERGNKLGCLIKSPERYDSDDGNIYLVGETMKVTAGEDDFPVSAKGLWTANAPGVTFSNPHGPTTVVEGLPEGEAELRFQISAGIEAFAGDCTAYVVSLRATAPPASRAVCSDTTEVEAHPLPVNIPGLVSMWTSEDQRLVIKKPGNPQTLVSNLRPGDNTLVWRLEMAGAVSEVEVNAKRDTLALPFGATGHHLTKRIVNMKSLRLPMEARDEWPSNPSEWRVPGNETVVYKKDYVELLGIEPNKPATFQFMIKPTGASSCTQSLFTLEVVSVTADIMGTTIPSECDLLRGATMTLRAGGGLRWKTEPEEADFEDLRNSLGDTLYHAFDDFFVDEEQPDVLTIFFKPAYFPAGSQLAAKGLTVRGINVPSTLLADNVMTPEHAIIQFVHPNGVVSDEFTIHPITVGLSFNGQRYTNETVLNTQGGQLEVSFHHLNVTDLESRLRDEKTRLMMVKSVTRKTQPRIVGELGWDERKLAMIDINSVKLVGEVVVMRVDPDEWYTVGANENLHMSGLVSSMCGVDPVGGEEREVRSMHDLKIVDEPPRLVVTGAVNECDFETLGANITVTAVGCSFRENSVFKPQYLTSNQDHLEMGWTAVVARGLFTTSSIGDSPKKRTLHIHPAGVEIYEIPQRTHEVLTLHVPGIDLVHAGVSDSEAFTAEGRVYVNDTYIEVFNTEICAEGLRSVGHQLDLKLHGDAWVPSALGTLVGAISGDRSIKGGWETAMMTDILPNKRYELVLVSDTLLRIKFPPMPGYVAVEDEEVGIKVPGVATTCSKCLAHEGLLRIYHAHSVVSNATNIRRGSHGALSFSLPCSRFSMELTKSEVLDSIRSVTRIIDGFDSHKYSLISTQSISISNQTITVPINWHRYNDTHAEDIVLNLSAAVTIPVSEKFVVSQRITIDPTAEEHRVGLVMFLFRGFCFMCPVLLYLTFYDFMENQTVSRFVGKQAVKLGLEAHKLVTVGFTTETLLCGFLWVGQRDHWMYPIAGFVYLVVAVLGILVFGGLFFLTEFTRISSASGTSLFSTYVNFCCIFSAGVVFQMIL